MSAVIVMFLKQEYALPDNRKWREHVSHDCAAYEMEVRNALAEPESRMWRNMSAVIVLLMKWKYALSASQKWREHISNMIALLMKWKHILAETGTCQQ